MEPIDISQVGAAELLRLLGIKPITEEEDDAKMRVTKQIGITVRHWAIMEHCPFFCRDFSALLSCFANHVEVVTSGDYFWVVDTVHKANPGIPLAIWKYLGALVLFMDHNGLNSFHGMLSGAHLASFLHLLKRVDAVDIVHASALSGPSPELRLFGSIGEAEHLTFDTLISLRVVYFYNSGA